MARAHYRIEKDGSGWLVWFEGQSYGPYRTELDAFKTAVHAADGARKENPEGADVLFADTSGERFAWTSEQDSFPMDYQGRLEALPREHVAGPKTDH